MPFSLPSRGLGFSACYRDSVAQAGICLADGSCDRIKTSFNFDLHMYVGVGR